MDRPRHGLRGRVLRNFSGLLAVRGINLVIPVLVLPYILRRIGLEAYGQIAFALAFATFFGAVIQYGFGISAVGRIARARGDDAQVARVFGATFATTLLLTLVCALVYGAIVLAVPAMAAQGMLYFGAFTLVAATALFPHWLFLGLERSYLAALVMLFVRLGYVLLLPVLIRGPQDYALVHLLNGTTVLVGVLAALGIAVYGLGVRPVRPTLAEVRGTLRQGFRVFLIQFVPNLYNNALVFVLGLSAPAALVGVFSVANSIVEVVISVGRMLSNAFLPVLAKDMSVHGKYAALMLGLGGAAALALLGLAVPLAGFLAPDNGPEIAASIRLIGLSVPLAGGYLAYNINYLVVSGQDGAAAGITVAGSIAGMGLVLALVPALQIDGAIAVLLLTRLGLFAASFLHYRKLQRSGGKMQRISG